MISIDPKEVSLGQNRGEGWLKAGHFGVEVFGTLFPLSVQEIGEEIQSVHKFKEVIPTKNS